MTKDSAAITTGLCNRITQIFRDVVVALEPSKALKDGARVLEEMSAIGVDLRSISGLSDHNEAFRQAIIKWIIKYSKDERRKWGHIKLAKALVKNAYPELADNKAHVEDNASPFYETLRGLLYKNKTDGGGVVTLSKNRHLFDLICLFVFNEDFDFFKYQLYGSRIEQVATSFLLVNKGLDTATFREKKAGRSVDMRGLYEDMKNQDLFWDIKSWNPGYLQLIRVLQRLGELGTYYEKNPGILVEQDFGHIGFVYSEHSRTMLLYRLAGFYTGKKHEKIPDFSVRVLADGSSISFKKRENERISKLASTMELQNG